MSARHVLCNLEEIPDGSAKSFVLEMDGTKREVLVVRKSDKVFG